VPLSDFVDVDMNNVKVVFALWNAVDVNQDFVQATVYVDNLHFAN
jgi:hypothetical protein